MDALPEDWQAVPNEKEKCEEITRLTVWRRALISIPVTRFYARSSVPAPYSQPHRVLIANVAHASCVLFQPLQVPENLSDIDRATTLLLGGYPQQQKSVVDR